MRSTFVLALLAGCGFEGGTDSGTNQDGSTLDDSTPLDSISDGDIDAPSVLGMFGAPAKISTGGAAEDPTCTTDRLELYFVASGPGGVDVWRMTRSNVANAWGSPALVSPLNSPAGEYAPSLSADGLTIWFSSDRSGGGGGGFDLWTSTRASSSAAFAAPEPVTELNTSQTDSGPGAFSSTRMVFHRIASGRRQLFEVTRANATAPWGTPVPLAELNTGSEDRNPHLATSLEIYFASERGGTGGQDLHVATRPAIGMPFGTPAELDEVSTSSNETSPWVSPDRRHLVFASDRDGMYEIYESSR